MIHRAMAFCPIGTQPLPRAPDLSRRPALAFGVRESFGTVEQPSTTKVWRCLTYEEDARCTGPPLQTEIAASESRVR